MTTHSKGLTQVWHARHVSGPDGKKPHGRFAVRRGLSVALLLAATVVQLVVGTAPAIAQTAPQTWEVQVGGGDMATFIDVHAFLPNPLTIRAGDTVSWKFASFHNVTFNAGMPPLPEFLPGSAPGEVILGPSFFPTGPSGMNARFDGTVQAGSGVPLEGDPEQFQYQLTFPRAGTFGYVCTIHPGMRGEIIVLPAGATLPETPAQAKARGQATLNTLIGKMKDSLQHVLEVHLRPMGPGMHMAFVGIGDGFGISLLQFVGGDKTIRRGDTVVWSWPDPFELHTVTFTSGGRPPDPIEPRPQPSGPPQLVLPANVVAPAGGSTYTGQGYVHSGLLEAPGVYALTFDAPPGRYEYLCLLHPFMKGTITVTG
jgi:plastocyanin